MVCVPAVSGVFELDDARARQLWNWVLGRQGLADHRKFSSVADIAQASLGLHAARLPSPFATVLARSKTPDVALSIFSSDSRELVTTIRCMRKTLHTLPLPLAAAAHAATLHFRERDALRAITNAGIIPRLVLRAVDAISGILVDGPLFHREIEERLTGPRRPVATVRLALKLAWERGSLSYVNDSLGWNREYRMFGLTKALYPELDMTVDRAKATGELVREYFERYGPATLKDVMWWSALSRTAVVTALAESGRDWVEMRTEWCDAPLYMYRDRLAEFEASEQQERVTGLNFLAHEDVALKAYFESQRRYLGALPAQRAFNQIGEVLPTIVQDGQVVGTWSWDVAKRRVTTSIARGYGSAELSREVPRHRERLTEALRAGWVEPLADGPSAIQR